MIPPATWLRRRIELTHEGRRRTGIVATQRNRIDGMAQLVVALESAEGLACGHAFVTVPIAPPAELAADRNVTLSEAATRPALALA